MTEKLEQETAIAAVPSLPRALAPSNQHVYRFSLLEEALASRAPKTCRALCCFQVSSAGDGRCSGCNG